MGYVKVKKAAGAFDVVCAENVGTVKAVKRTVDTALTVPKDVFNC